MTVNHSDDNRAEYGKNNQMMSEAGQDIVRRWDW